MTRAQQGVVLFLTLFLGFLFFLNSSPSFFQTGKSLLGDRPLTASKTPDEEIWIEVDGPVQYRGVFAVEKGEKVRDVIAKAGGLQEGLSLPSESLSVKLEKSVHLRVTAGEERKGKVVLQPLDPQKMKVLSLPVNINTAKAEDLDILPGVGPKMAQAIIAHREAHGKFSSPEDLMQVKGIGPKKFASLRPHVMVAD
jgi:competence protein ComEA